jgi:hypothetical protein
MNQMCEHTFEPTQCYAVAAETVERLSEVDALPCLYFFERLRNRCPMNKADGHVAREGWTQLTALKGLVKSTILSRVFNFIMAFNVMMAQNYLDFGSRNRMVMIKY